MKWTLKRKILLSFIFFAFAFILIIIFYFLFLKPEPTCFDGKQNQNELGIDCSGSCLKPCAFEINEPVIKWAKAFKISKNQYNILAEIKNPNNCFVAKGFNYEVQIFDLEKKLIKAQKGQSFNNLNCSLDYIFYLKDINLPKEPSFVNLSILDLNWQKEIKKNNLITEHIKGPYQDNNKNKLNLRFKNIFFEDIKNTNIFVFLLDEYNNIIYYHQTKIDLINSNSSAEFTFSWDKSKFNIDNVKSKRIIYQVD